MNTLCDTLARVLWALFLDCWKISLGVVMNLGSHTPILLALCLFVYVAQPAKGQTSTSGSVSGVVTDQTDAVVLGVEVAVKDESQGFRQTTATSTGGSYELSFLEPGI